MTNCCLTNERADSQTEARMACVLVNTETRWVFGRGGRTTLCLPAGGGLLTRKKKVAKMLRRHRSCQAKRGGSVGCPLLHLLHLWLQAVKMQCPSGERSQRRAVVKSEISWKRGGKPEGKKKLENLDNYLAEH